jgi:predicted nuclease of restriction endonuclease-like (RecB) superfamily
MTRPIKAIAQGKNAPSKALATIAPAQLLKDLRALIGDSRQRIAQAVNSALVLLYWQVGQRIRTDILNQKRADYGKEIVHALSGQLSWTHLRQIIYLKEPLQREFYAEMCRVERWSTRKLADKIQGMLYERTAISRKPAQLAKQELKQLREEDRITPDLIFRDPYLLDILGLKDTYSEKDIETAILRELERFLVELGTHFAFVARQKRITIDNQDYYIDLLFYHRGLRRLVAIDLKLGKFQAADKGQMELYLRWLAKHEQQPHEESPLGLILCAEKSTEHVELLELERTGIRVAEYLTELPAQKVLQRKLHEAIRLARKSLSGQRRTSVRTLS